MARIIRQLRKVEHTFGDEEPTGWIPPNAARPPHTPKRTVLLDVSIEEVDGGFILQWHGPSPEYSGDHWYAELPYAEHAAEELFGIASEHWESAA